MKTTFIAISIFISSSLLNSVNASEFKLGGDMGGGKVVGLVTNDRKVHFKNTISDIAFGANNEALSFDLQSGDRIYSDEIKALLLKGEDNSFFEKKISDADLYRVFTASSGGDGGGG